MPALTECGYIVCTPLCERGLFGEADYPTQVEQADHIDHTTDDHAGGLEPVSEDGAAVHQDSERHDDSMSPFQSAFVQVLL